MSLMKKFYQFYLLIIFMQFKQKPLTLVCYICGREFGSRSLEIHLRSCKDKFVTEQNKKEKKERINLPEQPQILKELLRGNLQNIQEYNQQATQIHKYKMLPACRYCGRTFNEDSLKVHEKVCSNKSNSFGKMKKEESSKEEIIKKPRTLVCCVCGREFGLASLKIHYPQCLQKFKNDQKKKPKEERKQVPKFTYEDLQMINNKEEWTLEEIEQFNQKASACFRDKGMIHCQNCKRTFLPEPYKRHLKNCELINGKNVKQQDPKPSNSYSKISEISDIKKPKVLMCHICGRQFGLSSLQIHQKTCKIKFLNNQKRKPGGERKPLPQMPDEINEKFDFQSIQKWNMETIEEYNKLAGEAYRNESMYECPLCHRKFIEQSYYKHKTYCQKQHEKQSEINLPDRSPSPLKPESKKTDFSRKSPSKIIQKHQTIKEMPEELEETKKMQEEVKIKELPLSDNITFKLSNNEPLIPLTQNESVFLKKQTRSSKIVEQISQKNAEDSSGSEKSIVKDVLQVSSFSEKGTLSPPKTKGKEQKGNIQNKTISQQKYHENPHMNHQLPEQNVELGQCQKCGRKFVIERLEKHENICKGTKKDFNFPKNNFKKQLVSEVKHQKIEKNQLRKPQPSVEIKKQDNNDQLGPQGHSKMLLPCKKCGRRFLDTRVQQHQQHCKGKKQIPIKQAQKKLQQQEQKMKSELNYKRCVPKKFSSLEEKQNKGETQPLRDVMAGYNQFQEIPASDLKPCTKCGRKFKIDRVEVHENVCKGPSTKNPNFNRELQEAEKARNAEIVRKTKENFFKMVKDIKTQKISEDQIDRDLSQQLHTLHKEPQSGRALQRKKIDFSSKERQEGALTKESKTNMQKLEIFDEFQSVSKWKKPSINRTPKNSISKGAKLPKRLPEL